MFFKVPQNTSRCHRTQSTKFSQKKTFALRLHVPRSHSGVAAHGPAHRHNYDELAVRAHDEQRRISFFICLTRRAIARRGAQSTRRRWASRRSRHVGVVAHGPAQLYNYDELAVRAHEQRRLSFFMYLTRRATTRRAAQSSRRCWASHWGIAAISARRRRHRWARSSARTADSLGV